MRTAKGVNEKEAMDELLTADEFATGRAMGPATMSHVYAEYRRLAAEQAAVRRVGTWWPAGFNRGRYSTR